MALTTPLRRLGEAFADFALKYIPDAFVFAIVLTLIAFLAAIIPESVGGPGASPIEALDAWFDGVWTLLEFMAAFAVILMTGDAMAKSPAVTRLLERIAGLPTSQFTAVAFTALTAMLAALISWGLGLIVGAVIARQVAYQGRENGLDLHYPLLAAAGYTGLMVWHSGLTTSSGLIMASPSTIPDTFPQYAQQGISLGETLGSTVNIVTVLGLLVVIPLVMAALHPDERSEMRELPDRVAEQMTPRTESGSADPTQEDVAADGGTETRTPADRLDESALLTVLIAAFPAYYFLKAWFVGDDGGLVFTFGHFVSNLSINSINALFLFTAIVLWRTPIGIVEQMEESVENVSGIIFQFPFYAGISGLLTGTALAGIIAQFFADVATPLTWPVLGLISAGIVNVFVPSGGGQWVAQGPILLETTRQLGMPIYTAVDIEMMGDQLTNMIQPFWALPLLALADLRARDIIGYSTVAMLAGFVVMAITMTVILGMGIGA